ncbi:MAG: hypothetical protein ACYCX9_12325 [Candidatus Dormibacteria bacterium]|jgi:mannitol-specific phosphotransferase system IIBC component|nr:hypothetical protein [Candidatus Dormibacteraeota bacterium]
MVAAASTGLGLDWLIGLICALVVVLVVAALLLAIDGAARGILNAAGASLGAVERIRQSTVTLFDLTTTNEVAAGILSAAGGIARDATVLAGALESTEAGEGSS